jgi:hypothetical protein
MMRWMAELSMSLGESNTVIQTLGPLTFILSPVVGGEGRVRGM